MQPNTAQNRRGFFWGGKHTRLEWRTRRLNRELSLLEQSLLEHKRPGWWTPCRSYAAGIATGAAAMLAWAVYLS